MKSYLQITSLLLFSSIFSTNLRGAEISQPVRTQERPRLGIQGGATFSNVSGPSDINSSNRTGLAVGVNLEIPVGAYTSFQPEVVFVRRGVELGNINSARLVAEYDSLQIPLFAKLSFDPDFSPFLVAGPVVTFNLASRLQASSPAGTSEISFNPKTYELGVALGGGLDVGPFFANIRYLWGLTDLDDATSDWKSRGLDILAGVRF